MNAPSPPVASVTAQAVHAAYLVRVAAWLDADLSAADADLLIQARHLTLAEVAYLVDRVAVPYTALLADGDGLGRPLLTGRVEFLDGRAPRFAWRPDDGVPALVAVVQGIDGSDVAAFSLRDGLVGMLGGAALIGGQDLDEEPVTVHRDAAAWLRAGRRGVVLLDRGRCLPALRGCASIVVDDRNTGLALERALAVRMPRIGVREAA